MKDDNTKFIRTGHILPKIWQHPTWLVGWLISINSTVTSERRQQHRVMDNGSRVQLKAPFSGLFFFFFGNCYNNSSRAYNRDG